MHGDFSRGHRPDGKRGLSYTRGFAQQRRLLLDSDINAMTDALHERLRALARQTGCPKGSPDLGYLVTPGRLLAVFRDLTDVVTAAANVTFLRDYSEKYLDRYPSLSMNADQGVNGSVTLRLRHMANGATTFWCRADAATTVTLSGGVALNVPANAAFQPVTVNLGSFQTLQIDFNAGEQIWIALIETQQTATAAPRFDYASGHYYLDGLVLSNAADTTWLTNAIPPAAPFNLANGTRLLVYLEGGERHVTCVEDPGLLENALGGDTDTTTRGHAVGQVKIALVPAGFDLEGFSRALNSPVLPNGTLDVTTPPAAPDPDPCALPTQGGYTGRDNRLYRFEVHNGGALGAASFKWSRDNGAELFPVISSTDQTLTFPANVALQPGDLVEVLTAGTIEFGDASPATLNAAGSTFTPSTLAVGRLARLQAATSAGTGVAFSLREPDGVAQVTLAAHFGPFPTTTLKVRRWHGLIQTAAAPVPNVHAIENGIEVAINGSFSPGDYWQYEARAGGGENDNGPFQQTPHGPERDYGPLALMQFNGVNQPLLLERWLDHRFPPLCELTADDIAFDGDRIGSDSDTVQEVIEELWERSGGGCCDFTITAEAGDASAQINEILQNSQGEVLICLEPGVYTLAAPISISNRKVILKGCPRAVLVAQVNRPFRVAGDGRLRLESLVLIGFQTANVRILVDMLPESSSFEAMSCGLFAVPNPAVGQSTQVIQVGDFEPTPFNPNAPVPTTTGSLDVTGPTVKMDGCVAAATWIVVARALTGLDLESSFFNGGVGVLFLENAINARLVNCDYLAGIDLSKLNGWSPDQLLSGADTLAEQLSGFGSGIAPPLASVCIRGRLIVGLSITDSRFSGGYALAITRPAAVTLQGNLVTATHTGYYLGASDQVTITGDRVGGTLVENRGGQYGIQILRGINTSVTDCLVERFLTGIVLGGESGGSGNRTFRETQVQNNNITGAITGVQLGPANGMFYTGELYHLAITENNITAQALGVMVNANTANSSGGGLTSSIAAISSSVRASDNMITARIGIGVIGNQVEVSDNRILLFGGVGSRYGVYSLQFSNVVCEHNQIDIRAANATANVSFAAALTADQVSRAGLFGSFISGTQISSSAIQVVSGAEARISGNTAQAEPGASMRAFRVESHQRLVVSDNQLYSGNVELNGVFDLSFLSNSVLGNASFTNCTDGNVCDNRIRQRTNAAGTSGNLTISSARGGWKVCDNRVDGDITILPVVTFPGGFDFNDIFTNAVIGVRPNVLEALGSMAALSRNETFSELIFNERSVNAERIGVSMLDPGAASMSLRNSDWNATYRAGVTDFIAAGFRNAVGTLADDFSIAVIGYWFENVYHVQCNSNWSRRLNIGSSLGRVAGSTQSTVQVVANRAVESISVKQYRLLVIAMNMAASYPQAGNAGAAAIVQPNLLI